MTFDSFHAGVYFANVGVDVAKGPVGGLPGLDSLCELNDAFNIEQRVAPERVSHLKGARLKFAENTWGSHSMDLPAKASVAAAATDIAISSVGEES